MSAESYMLPDRFFLSFRPSYREACLILSIWRSIAWIKRKHPNDEFLNFLWLFNLLLLRTLFATFFYFNIKSKLTQRMVGVAGRRHTSSVRHTKSGLSVAPLVVWSVRCSMEKFRSVPWGLWNVPWSPGSMELEPNFHGANLYVIQAR